MQSGAWGFPSRLASGVAPPWLTSGQELSDEVRSHISQVLLQRSTESAVLGRGRGPGGPSRDVTTEMCCYSTAQVIIPRCARVSSDCRQSPCRNDTSYFK